MKRAYSYVLWGLIGLLTLLWFPLVVVVFAVTAPFDPGRYAVGRCFRWCAMSAAKVVPTWDFRTEGFMIQDPRRPYVAVANHESFADIFLIAHLPWEMKWLSKASLFRIPLMGWMMRMAGDIAVRREARQSRVEALAEIHDRLDKKVTVIILPEGTRSPDGRLQKFRNGAFKIAIQRQLPVLPIALAGTRSAMAKHSGLFNPARAVARVLEPVETTGMTYDDVPALRDRIREDIRAARDELRARLES